MKSRQEAFEALLPTLTQAIDKWADDASGDEQTWDVVGYIGDDTYRLMARAALAVLEASADVQDYLKKEGQLQ